ncbi:ParB/RepB/Spo0J family partition protein [Pediococcus ethanolidurans]|uniref:ParB/RepB/Spo0J family partition protein n=1 Tax=Pediococcus ethanolidurans TaxID=319653 RepID=UPI001C1E944F|nr:ParB/RepB/Spo0J family partition protein [Pediococcus ethanolidurans]MBU7554777.1 ParB/RepB/Spo0J family partition protein [Pediococcus ethanolidurans]MCT4398777.1 ParB/RepB/Spo0J family partition protein [Pediococcus ethanolidurans]MCV3315306.1 ParB/RepB/Spo0J family partition protein [Pediococcus ethanolidurans]MCV3322561.1 ParB/RepB/Spo0J family partition protein [Pediococcus ethanolidurans]MCV3323310.1 ParB/RepB/Spo0J family partition protein [Pediococcus ethanolidurans]
MTSKPKTSLGAEKLLKDEDTKQVVEINLKDIHPNPYQPRHNFDSKALRELANSIQESGVFQPIIVRKQTASAHYYELIAGERRFRAAKMAGLHTIPALISQLSDAETMEAAVIENLQREDLTPLEEAQAYDSLMAKLNFTQAQVSEKLGKSRPYIANYLRLLRLPQTIKNMLQAGELSMGQARTLLALKNRHKLIPLAKRVVSEHLTVRQLENLVNRLNMQQPQKDKLVVKARKESRYVRAIEEQLQEKFGTKAIIDQKEKGGKIEINYMSNDDLSRILSLLNISLD